MSVEVKINNLDNNNSDNNTELKLIKYTNTNATDIAFQLDVKKSDISYIPLLTVALESDKNTDVIPINNAVNKFSTKVCVEYSKLCVKMNGELPGPPIATLVHDKIDGFLSRHEVQLFNSIIEACGGYSNHVILQTVFVNITRTANYFGMKHLLVKCAGVISISISQVKNWDNLLQSIKNKDYILPDDFTYVYMDNIINTADILVKFPNIRDIANKLDNETEKFVDQEKSKHEDTCCGLDESSDSSDSDSDSDSDNDSNNKKEKIKSTKIKNTESKD
jgi:hypothetical protein